MPVKNTPAKKQPKPRKSKWLVNLELKYASQSRAAKKAHHVAAVQAKRLERISARLNPEMGKYHSALRAAGYEAPGDSD